MLGKIILVIIILVIAYIVSIAIYFQYKKIKREVKNYERGLKMVPIYIHIPPSGEDLEANGRDERDVAEEVLSQSQVMYDIISSTAQKGFKSKI